MVAEPNEAFADGGVWTFTKAGETWTKLGNELTGEEGFEPFSVALSKTGTTALIGSPHEPPTGAGAARFSRARAKAGPKPAGPPGPAAQRASKRDLA